MDKKGEMEEVAGVFDFYGLPETAKAIRGLSNDLYVVCIETDFEKALGEIKLIFKTEFISSGSANASFRSKLHLAYVKLYESANKANNALVEKLFRDFEDSMRRISNSYGVIGDVAKNFLENKNLTIKQKYYAECFTYLLIVEGVFRELCEYILVLDDIRSGHSRSFSEIEELHLSNLVNEIRSKADISVFTEGYKSRLRNAIAHANFRFDENTQEINFKDEYKGKVRTIPPLKIEDFGVFYLKIDDVYRLITSFWELLSLVIIYSTG
jgi:hypothetical protein